MYRIERVGRCSVLNSCPMELFRGSVVFVRVSIERVCHGQEQMKDLFRQFCVHLLRILEDVIVEYKSLRGNLYTILCHIVTSCMVVCTGPYGTSIRFLLPVGLCAV